MYKIQLQNKIAKIGTDRFPAELYSVGADVADPAAILVRSANMLDSVFSPETLAIARAGAGVNNIPLDRCRDAGIVVFNTPGANANGVKELAILAMLLASRDVVGGISWAETLTADVAKSVEAGKSNFGGGEILGKTLGVIGLGAIGAMVAKSAAALGMKVVGCDPYISEDTAAGLSALGIVLVDNFDAVYAAADFLSLSVPTTPQTKGMINAETLAKCKPGLKLINMARADLVNNADLKAALEVGAVSKYVTDFPVEATLGTKGIINIPHLGASTEESEDNCAIMAVDQIRDYIENGNITNSVNFPNLSVPKTAKTRVCVLATKEVDLAAFGAVTSKAGKSSFYAVVDTDDTVDTAAVAAIDGVVGVRVI